MYVNSAAIQQTNRYILNSLLDTQNEVCCANSETHIHAHEWDNFIIKMMWATHRNVDVNMKYIM